MRSGSSESGDRTRSRYRSPAAGRSSASAGAGLRTGGTGGNWGARASRVAASWRCSQRRLVSSRSRILVGHDLVTTRGGWPPTVRVGSGLQRGGVSRVFPGGVLVRRAQRMVALVPLAELPALRHRRPSGASSGQRSGPSRSTGCRSAARRSRSSSDARGDRGGSASNPAAKSGSPENGERARFGA